MVIGLTGKSCSGKNYVGEILASKGLEVWDTDKMCHDGLNDNIRAIVSVFGEEVIRHSDGKEEVSRPALGKIVFSDPARRKALEDILYPWLGKKVEEWTSYDIEDVQAGELKNFTLDGVAFGADVEAKLAILSIDAKGMYDTANKGINGIASANLALDIFFVRVKAGLGYEYTYNFETKNFYFGNGNGYATKALQRRCLE